MKKKINREKAIAKANASEEFWSTIDGDKLAELGYQEKDADMIGKTLFPELFLDFISKDIESYPNRVQPLREDLFERANAFTCGLDIDLNSKIEEDEE